jgi:hypothetical protein
MDTLLIPIKIIGTMLGLAMLAGTSIAITVTACRVTLRLLKEEPLNPLTVTATFHIHPTPTRILHLGQENPPDEKWPESLGETPPQTH